MNRQGAGGGLPCGRKQRDGPAGCRACLPAGQAGRRPRADPQGLRRAARWPARFQVGGPAAADQERRPGAHLDAPARWRRDGRGGAPSTGWHLALGDRPAQAAAL